jgi:hypothetical protein
MEREFQQTPAERWADRARTPRALLMALAVLLVCAAPAVAAPRIAGISSITKPFSFDYVQTVEYDGSVAASTPNRVTATVLAYGKSVAFYAPLTLMVPAPKIFHLQEAKNCDFGLTRASCSVPAPPRYPSPYVWCAATVTGGDGADEVTLRGAWPGFSGYGGQDYCSNWFSSAVTGGGNDVVDAEGTETSVLAGPGNDVADVVDGKGDDFVDCGPGFDRVYRDSGDIVMDSCESFTTR